MTIVTLKNYVCVLVAQSCLTLCKPMNGSPPGSSVHGILQARILGWVAISFSRGSSWLRDQTQVSCITGGCFCVWATMQDGNKEFFEDIKRSSCVSCFVVFDSLPTHGLWLARLLCLWNSRDKNPGIAIPFSRKSSKLRNQTCVYCIAGRFFAIWITNEALLQENP